LVNRNGLTLYTFDHDKARGVTCTGRCAAVWTPVRVNAGQEPSLSGAINSSLVSSVPDPAGGRVITYAGWPLYTYVSDPTPGTAHGQALGSEGGVWYVITPSGQVIRKHGGAASSSGPGNY
jgi:predicted lipoprotein with Yx(FWY)xxD motif